MISTFFYTYFTLFGDIMLSPIGLHKTGIQLKTKDEQRYFIVQSIASDYG
jgi:hypothetical protein